MAGQDNFLLILILSLIIMFMASALIIIAQEPVSFGIDLNKKNFEYGDDLILYYSISNWWPQSITDITLDVGIQNYRNTEETHSYNESNLFKKINGNYTITTPTYLSRGEKTIEANLRYTKPSGEEQTKSLTLKFNVG